MHDLTKYTTEALRNRFEELQVGPTDEYDAIFFHCGCDEDCAYDSLDAIETELAERWLDRVQRELEAQR